MTAGVDLDVIIVAYRKPEMVKDCVVAVLNAAAHDGLQAKVHVVDNASGDGTVEALLQRFGENPTVNIMEQGWNSGFARANNRALTGVRAGKVLLLNPDTIVPRGALADCMRVLDENPSAGMVGCRLVQSSGKFDHAAKRSFPNPTAALAYFLGGSFRARSRYLSPEVDEHGLGAVDAVNGAFMLVRSAAMRQVGPLDEKYWMYGEDLDWCRRFQQAGWQVIYNGRVTVVHLKGASSGARRSAKLNWHFHKSMILFYLDHQRQNLLMDGCVVGAILARAAWKIATDSTVRIFSRRRAPKLGTQ